jgi:hypothetical protein
LKHRQRGGQKKTTLEKLVDESQKMGRRQVMLWRGEGGINNPPGLIADKDGGNKSVFTYVESRREAGKWLQ